MSQTKSNNYNDVAYAVDTVADTELLVLFQVLRSRCYHMLGRLDTIPSSVYTDTMFGAKLLAAIESVVIAVDLICC